MQIKRSAKEVVRHLILKSGLNSVYLALRTSKGQNVEHLRDQTLRERFSSIYQNQIWLQGRMDGSISGLGSEVENTKSIRQRLPGLLSELNTKTMIDAGCGDYNWMSQVSLNCNYVGVDLVQSVIDHNNLKYGSPTRVFYTLDATKDPLPSADTLLCREMLFHLSFEDIWKFLRNVCSSNVETLIATTDVSTSFNADIISGDFRVLNLMKRPFRFPQAELEIPDDAVTPGRVLAVWKVSKLKAALSL